MRGISRLAEDLASQEGPCSIKLVNGSLEKETTDVPPTDTLKIDETSVRDSHSQ